MPTMKASRSPSINVRSPLVRHAHHRSILLSTVVALLALFLACSLQIVQVSGVYIKSQYLPKDDPSCDFWAQNDDECIKNPSFMWTACLGSCREFARDEDVEKCQNWAAAGECSANPRYIQYHCPEACGFSLAWNPWARRSVALADATISQLQQDAAKVEPCNGVGVDAFAAASIMYSRLQRFMDGQYVHMRGFSTTAPSEFLGILGLVEGVLYALRMYEVVLQKASPTDEHRAEAVLSLFSQIDSIRTTLKLGYAADPLVRLLPQWVKELETFHRLADEAIKQQARANNLEQVDLCRPKHAQSPSMQAVNEYFNGDLESQQQLQQQLKLPSLEEQQQGFTIGTYATLSNGVKMPLMGLGCWQLMGQTVVDAVLHAIRVGYRAFDAAEAYRNEAEIGLALEMAVKHGLVSSRSDLFIASKISDPSNAGYLAVQQLVARQLRDLRTSYLDLYMLHSPIADKKLQQETWRALEDMVRSGTIRAIGVSNFNSQELRSLYETATIKPMVVQNKADPYHVGKQLDNKGDFVVDFARKHNILVVAYSTISSYPFTLSPVHDPIVQYIAAKHSFSALQKQQQPSTTTGAGVVDLIGADGSIGDAIAVGGSAALVSPGQVLLRWALQKGFAVIPRSSNPGRIEENFAALQMAPLTVEDMSLIDTLQLLVSNPVAEPVRV